MVDRSGSSKFLPGDPDMRGRSNYQYSVNDTGEVRDVRTRNRTLYIAIGVIALVLLLLIVIALLVYFLVFAAGEEPKLQVFPESANGSLFWYKTAVGESGLVLSDKIEEFLKPYYEQAGKGNLSKCTDDYIKENPDPSVPCAYDLSHLAEQCSRSTGYGYLDGRGSPCVILKLERIRDWQPEPYNPEDLEEAESNGMPTELVRFIKAMNETTPEAKRQLNTTWISCEGVSQEDMDKVGHINYFFPGFNRQSKIFMGIPNMFFPYQEQESYLDPFIFVKFTRPERNVTLQVKCHAWAKNIGVEDGSVTFELLVQ